MRIASLTTVLLLFLTGCAAPPGPEPTGVNLGAAEEWGFSSQASFSPLSCAPDSRPSASAQALGPFAGSVADVVRATAKTLGADLEQVYVTDRTVTAGDVQYVYFPSGSGGAGAPMFSIEIEGRAWPPADSSRLERLQALRDVMAPDDAEVGVFRDDERWFAGTIGAALPVTGHASVYAYYGPGRTDIDVYPFFRIPWENGTESDTLVVAAGYAACAHPGAEPTEGRTITVEYDSGVVKHLFRTEEEGHHCGGPAWWIGVDTSTLTVLTDTPHLCY